MNKPSQNNILSDANNVIFDHAQAKRIAIGKVALLQKLAAQFEKDMPPYLHKLHQALDENDVYRAGHLAHTIKGSALSMGAIKLGTLAHHMEVLLKQEQLQDAITLFEDLNAALQELLAVWHHTDWKDIV